MPTYENQTGRLAPQSLLQERYVIIDQAGRGGMGAVYHAIDTSAGGRHVAIKELSQAHLSEEQLVEATAQFQHEARLLGSLSHPNLPRVYNAFTENERSYLVMDFIQGKTLVQLLREASGQPLPILHVLRYAIQLCNVLSYLHSQQPPIIFRDLKPSNVMVTEQGHIYLIDFGIARFFKEGQAQDTVFLGSPGYAPPEQHGTSQTNPRSDIYALGATLHYCLSARDPYFSNYKFVFPSIRQYNPYVSPELDQLILRMVAANEWQRPATAAEVQQTLQNIIAASKEYSRALLAEPALPTTDHSASLHFIPPASIPPQPALVASSFPSVCIPAPNRQQTALSLPVPQVPASPYAIAIPHPPASETATKPSLWTLPFMVLFSCILLLTTGVSIYALNGSPSSDHIIEACLSAFLVLINLISLGFVKKLLPRLILSFSAYTSTYAGLAFAIQVCQRLHLLTGYTLPVGTNQFLTLSLLSTALLSFLWLIRPFSWLQRTVILFLSGVTALYIWLQAPYNDLVDIKHILLQVAIILLIQETLLVVRIEQTC